MERSQRERPAARRPPNDFTGRVSLPLPQAPQAGASAVLRQLGRGGASCLRVSGGSTPPASTKRTSAERQTMKPSHILKVEHRDSKYGTRVGASWDANPWEAEGMGVAP